MRVSRVLLWAGVVCAAGEASVGLAADADESGLQEVVVTAQRFNSTVQDTPISLSAITGDQLDAAGITSVEGLAHEVPGLSIRSAGPGQTEYEARGLASSGGSAPTVGFYLDDVPLSPPATSQTGKVVIDPNLYDVDRIELLRGPQGTLYGSGSMGGTVRVITNQPKLDTFEGSVQGTLSDTEGGGVNGGGNLMLNLPIGDTLAVRFVATDTYRSGWLNRLYLNPFPADTGTEMGRGNVLAAPVEHVFKNVNTEHLDGGRITVLFKPNDDFNVVTTVMFQHMGMGGYDEFDNPPGPAYDALYEAGNEGETVDDWFHFYSVEATLNLGFADLTSTSGYFQRHELQTQNASESISYEAGVYPYVSLPFSEVDITRQFSQELRLSSRGDGALHWVAGVFFSDDSSDWDEYSFTSNPDFATPDPITNGDIYNGDQYYRVRQTAAFVDGSYNFTDQWKFSTGVRYYHYSSSTNVFGEGLFAPTPDGSTFVDSVSSSGFNPRFNLSYSPNGDLNTYISASKGYRPGGPSYGPFADLVGCPKGVPPPFKADTIWDYEIGEKAKLFNNWLTINSDIYYIKWSNVQETVAVPCGYTFEANAGDGRSYGPELEVNAKLSQNWSVAASASYTNAEINHPSSTFTAAVLTNPVPGGIQGCESASHCTLPILNVPKDAASLSVIYTQPVLDNYTLNARVTDNFTGHAYDQAYAFGIGLPSYNLASARLGLSGDKWTATLFIDNITNKVAELATNNTQFQFNIPQLVRISTNQPRTFGTEVNYKF